jgi:hypothetical protein
MVLQYFNILFRRILKDRLFYFIILTNLAIGYAAFMMVSQFINGDLNWDRNNNNYDRIYRLQLFMDQNNTHTVS